MENIKPKDETEEIFVLIFRIALYFNLKVSYIMVMLFEERKYGLVAKPSYDQNLKYIQIASTKRPDTFIDRTAKNV